MILDEQVSSDASQIKDSVLGAEGKSLEDDFSSLMISAAHSAPGEQNVDDNLVNITDRGDLILVATDGTPAASPSFFRVDSKRLRSVSPYFEVLLGDDRFKEGALLRNTHEKFREEGIEPSEAPANKLPRITIVEMAQMVPSAPGTDHPMNDFLRILHGLGISYAIPKLSYLAGLASLADRFDCLPVVGKFVKERGFLLAREHKSKKSKSWEDISEQGLRQRILVGWLFDDPVWFRDGSYQLIVKGSRRWSDVEGLFKSDQSLWWSLPDGIEGHSGSFGCGKSHGG